MADPQQDEAILPPDTSSASVQPEPKAQPSRRSGAFLGGVLGGLIAAGCGFALAKVIPGGWPIAADPAVSAQLAKLTADTAALKAQVDGLSADPALIDRIAALEARSQAPDLLADLAALAQKVAGMSAGSGGADPAALKALQDQVAALAAQPAAVPAQIDAAVKAAQEKLDAATATAAAQAQTLASIGAWRQIAAALDSGGPYAAALDVVKDQNPPAVLADHAQSGLPTLLSLRASFPDVARAALDDARRADMGASWTDRIATFLQTQTGARSLTPREGNDPDAILSRAQAALDQGDLATTVTELAAMPEAAKPALADWLAQADLRIQAQKAIADLGAALGQ